MPKEKYTVIYLDPRPGRGWGQYCALKDTEEEARKAMQKALQYGAGDIKPQDMRCQVLVLVVEE